MLIRPLPIFSEKALNNMRKKEGEGPNPLYCVIKMVQCMVNIYQLQMLVSSLHFTFFLL